jgi:hypothetical protein
MVNKHNQIICDLTKIILEDGVTLYPGYVEIKDGMLKRYDSNDPINPKKPFELHHRVGHKFIAEQEPCNIEKLQGKHFMSRKAMEKWLADNK